jgi:hypothetical protein
MSSRLFSLVAVPLSLVGHLLFWGGSATLLRLYQQFGGTDPLAVLAVAAGILLIVAALATVALGGLGAFVVGAVHLLFSLLLHLIPLDLLGGGFSPAFDLMNAVRSASMEVSDGMFFYFPPGVGVVTGTVFLCAALASARRTTDATSRTRVLAGLAGILGVLGIVLAITGGGRLYYAQFVTLRGTDLPGIALLYGGAVLLAVAVLSSRWSSAGMIVAGGVSAIGGVLGLAAPQLLNAGPAAQELGRGLQIFGASGSLLLVGLLLIVGGLAVRFRGRRTAV